MSTLVIQVPARARAPARSAGDAAPAAEFDYVFSTDGRAVSTTGRAAPALLPKAGSVVAVLADADVAWHRIKLPKAPAARLRAALTGVLEDTLLDDEDALHLALPPRFAADQPTWVAVVHKPWLAATLSALEGAGLVVERVLPAAAPDEGANGHFSADGAAEGTLTLALVHADGAATLRTAGSLARALLPPAGSVVRWSATPAAAAAAERWLGARVTVLTEAERTLEATRGGWNLRQWDLAPRHRGMRALRDVGRRLRSPAWRPVRWGVAAFVGLQLVALNVAAWRAQQEIDARKTAMASLLQASHPGVRLVYDAPVQMQRETDRLRAAGLQVELAEGRVTVTRSGGGAA